MTRTARLARSALAATLMLACPAQAETPVTADEFEAMSEGRTLYFEQRGEDYGAEQYLENREVIWRYGDGTCAQGYWFHIDGAFCFVYENNPTPQCWTFARRDGDYYARITGLPPGDPSELRLSGADDRPLACNAPDLGV